MKSISKVASANQLALFDMGKVNGLGSVMRARESKGGAVTFDLLPTKAESGPDMKAASNGMKGGALKAFVAKRSHDLMRLESQQFNGLVSSGQYTGGRVRVTKSGSWTFTLKPATCTVLEVTEEGALAKLGLTAEDVAALKAMRPAAEAKAAAGPVATKQLTLA